MGSAKRLEMRSRQLERATGTTIIDRFAVGTRRLRTVGTRSAAELALGTRAAAELALGRLGHRGRRTIPIVVVSVLGALLLAEELLVLATAIDAPRYALWARDFELYMDATRTWLAGGQLYPPEQLAGPFDLPWGQIFYPPHALALFVPFALLGPLGAPLFVLGPAVVTAAVILSYRPRFWAWVAILAMLVLHPDAPLPWIAGTPTIWVIMLVALATRWPWVSAFIWFKPSVFPFALAGIRDRRWWIVTGAFAISTVLLWPLVLQWVTVIANARGVNSGLLYSLSPTALAGPLIPVIAWLGRTRPGLAAGDDREAPLR
jgi:hypothetical protein